MSKILEVFIHFSKYEWAALRSKYTEQEIKWLITKGADKIIALKCEKIEDANFNNTDVESEEDEAV